MELEYSQWYNPGAENKHECERQTHWDCRGESNKLLTLWINEEASAGKKDGKKALECFRFYEREVSESVREPPRWNEGENEKEECGFEQEEDRERGGSGQEKSGVEEDRARGGSRREKSGVEEETEKNREERDEDGENEIGGVVNEKKEEEEVEECSGFEEKRDTSSGGDVGEKEELVKREEEEDDGRKDERCSMHEEKENEEDKCFTDEEVEEEEKNGERERKKLECSVLEERQNSQQDISEGEKCEGQDGKSEEEEGRKREEEFQEVEDNRESLEECERQVDGEKEKEREKDREQEDECVEERSVEEARDYWKEGKEYSSREEEDLDTRGVVEEEEEEEEEYDEREGNWDRQREEEEDQQVKEIKRDEEEYTKNEREADGKIEEDVQKEKTCGEEEDEEDECADQEEDEEEEEECNGGSEGWCECPECQKRPVLYCIDDLQPLCWVCGLSERHDGHRVCPPEQALKDCRVEVGVAMQPMFQSFKNLTKVRQTYKQMAEHIPKQSAKTKEQIHDQFEELRQFLRAEEEARIAAVREEQERKARALRQRAERTRGETRKLLHALRSSQMEMEAQGEEGLHFLQNYKNTVKRVWKANQGPEKSYDSLIDVSKHVGNLRFRVWEKMKDICPSISVTLDPNTASPFLHVSSDLTSVRDSGVDIDADGNIPDTGPNGSLPDNPERFACCGEMLGHEVITTSVPQRQTLRNRGLSFHRRSVDIDSDQSDRCTSWVVDVGDNNNWMLGVARRSVTRKSLLAACPENGCWALSLRQGQYEALESPAVPLALAPGDRVRKGGLAPGPQRVKVRVNHGSGRVCFTDADRHTHLYTFSHASAATGESLQPYFSTACQRRSIKVLPSPVTMTISHQGPGGKEEEGEEEEEEGEGEERQQDGQMMDESVAKPQRVTAFLITPESQKPTSPTDQ